MSSSLAPDVAAEDAALGFSALAAGAGASLAKAFELIMHDSKMASKEREGLVFLFMVLVTAI
jgi:hypothetical protein